MDDKDQLLFYLRFCATGRENATTARQIQRDTRLSPRRQRVLVNQLIDDGVPVLSVPTEKPRGYYIATSWQDAAAGLGHIDSRAMQLHVRKKKVEQALTDSYGGQQHIDLDFDEQAS